MCRFEKNLNKIYTISGIVLIIIIIMAMSSCSSGKMLYTPGDSAYIECENCDEID